MEKYEYMQDIVMPKFRLWELEEARVDSIKKMNNFVDEGWFLINIVPVAESGGRTSYLIYTYKRKKQ